MSFLRKHWLGITIGVLVVAAIALVIAFPPAILVPVIATVGAALVSPPAIATYLGLGVMATVGAAFGATYLGQLISRRSGKKSVESSSVVHAHEGVDNENLRIIHTTDSDVRSSYGEIPNMKSFPDDEPNNHSDVNFKSPLKSAHVNPQVVASTLVDDDDDEWGDDDESTDESSLGNSNKI